MATVAEVRAEVTAATELVIQAQTMLRAANHKLADAAAGYQRVQSRHLDGTIAALAHVSNRVDEAITQSFSVKSLSDAYVAGL